MVGFHFIKIKAKKGASMGPAGTSVSWKWWVLSEALELLIPVIEALFFLGSQSRTS